MTNSDKELRAREALKNAGWTIAKSDGKKVYIRRRNGARPSMWLTAVEAADSIIPDWDK